MSHRKFEAPRHGSLGFLPKSVIIIYFDRNFLPVVSVFFSSFFILFFFAGRKKKKKEKKKSANQLLFFFLFFFFSFFLLLFFFFFSLLLSCVCYSSIFLVSIEVHYDSKHYPATHTHTHNHNDHNFFI
jgi:hypothetical protein